MLEKFAAKIILTVLIATCLLPCRALSLTLITHYIGGNAPADVTGGGSLSDIVNAAARIWESAYSDPATVTIYFGWAPTGDAGTHSLLEQGGIPTREIAGLILFDNSGAARFYLDPTPDQNEEYQSRTDHYQDLGGGRVNAARLFSAPSGAAAGRVDLLSVVLHEMGHALGMCAANEAFMAEAGKGSICIEAGLPFAGTEIPLAINRAGITSHFDVLKVVYGSLMAGIASDERRLPADLDILADAQVSGWSIAGAEAPTIGATRLLRTHNTVRGDAGPAFRRK
jgi:hypothetical protein